jgi:hypothetical protein
MKQIYPIILGLTLIIFAGVSGCTGDLHPPYAVPQAPNVNIQDSCPIQDFGNGTLYFVCTEGNFAGSLSRYIGKNNVTILGIAPVPSPASYNLLSGYIVVVKQA